MDDTELTKQVKMALLGDEAIKSFDIEVDTHHSVVHLRGMVDTPDQKAEIEHDVQAVPGVQGVRNDLATR